MRYARCGEPQWHWHSVMATGELTEIERLTVSSERGGWKSARRGNSLAAYSTSSPVRRGLRHEVVSIFVMQKRSRHNPVFYHWYATRTCDQSNLMVRSFWDNGCLTVAGGL
jgi:hypothetical protein